MVVLHFSFSLVVGGDEKRVYLLSWLEVVSA